MLLEEKYITCLLTSFTVLEWPFVFLLALSLYICFTFVWLHTSSRILTPLSTIIVWCGVVCWGCRPQLKTFSFYFIIAASTLTWVCSNVRIQQKSKHTADTQPTGLTASLRSCVYSVQHPWVSSFQECLMNGFIGQPFTCTELCMDHSLVCTGNLC